MAVPRRKIERIALQEQAYELLKERVLDRGYAADEKLNIDALSRELHVSSTPIREALGRLAAEGLVRARPFVGFAVAPMPSHEHFEQLFELRLVVEPWAASRTALRRPPAILAELEAAVAAMAQGRLARHYRRFRDFSEADEAFHRAILEGTGNAPAVKAYCDLRIHLHLSRLYISREQNASVTHREHLAIFEAIRAGNADQAAARMREHLVLSRSKLLEDPTH